MAGGIVLPVAMAAPRPRHNCRKNKKAFTNFFVKAENSLLERETGFEPATFSLGS